MRSRREVRLSRGQFGVLAAASLVATAILIAGATGHSSAQLAVIAALRKHVVVHVSPPSAAGSTGVPSPASGPAPAALQADPSTPGPAAAPSGLSAAPQVLQGANTSSAGSAFGTPLSSSPATTRPPSKTTTTTHVSVPKPSKVRHVFVIGLSTPSFSAAFGPASAARYLNQTLRPRGTLLSGYQTLGESDLSDRLAAISGQGPNADTASDCPTYREFRFGTKPDAQGLIAGAGCVYPNNVLTIGDQITSAGLRWGAFVQGMSAAQAGRSPNCQHPDSNAVDPTQAASPGGGYVVRDNPFVYFHSLLDLGDCVSDDQPLDRLSAALSSVSRTPNYTFIAPSVCNDGSSSCAGSRLGGLQSADAFLARWVPRVVRSAAYKRDGALIVEFTRPPSSPDRHRPIPTGALVLSRYARPGRELKGRYDPYSLLHSVEDMFGVAALGHAGQASSFLTAALPGA